MYRIGVFLCLFVGLVSAKTISNSDSYNCNLTDNPKGFGLRCLLKKSSDPFNIMKDDSEASTCELSEMPPNPGSECCGIDVSTSPRIFGGSPTLLDQYPWLALIEYMSSDGQFNVKCGGSLISGYYVLTAAHCVVFPEEGITPWMVILGDYNRTHDGPDCIKSESGEEICSEKEVRVRIEKTIPHQFYRYDEDTLGNTGWTHNDIALVKLKDRVAYTTSIRPICLPTSDVNKYEHNTNLNLIVAGWGWTETSGEAMSDVKRHVRLSHITVELCQKFRNHITYNDVCAGRVEGQNACHGDSGGPLMKIKDDGRYELAGVVSYGDPACLMNTGPTVYTNVFRYKRWIMDVIQTGA